MDLKFDELQEEMFMNFKDYFKKLEQDNNKRLEGGCGLRHASQGKFYSETLLQALETELKLEYSEIKDDMIAPFSIFLQEQAFKFRQHYGYDRDKAKLEVTQTQAYKDLVKYIKELNVFSCPVTLYQTRNNELACKFPNGELRRDFMRALDSPDRFPAGHPLAGQHCAEVFTNNPDTVYFPGQLVQKTIKTTLAEKKLSTFFADNATMTRFSGMLGLPETPRVLWDKSNKAKLHIDVSALGERNTIAGLPYPSTHQLLSLITHSLFGKNVPGMASAVVEIINGYTADEATAPTAEATVSIHASSLGN